MKFGDNNFKNRFFSKKNALQLGLVGIGILLFVIQIVLNSGTLLASLFTPVTSPSEYSFPHFDALLKKYVAQGLINYQLAKKDPDLDLAVEELARTSPDRIVDEKAKLCFWINAQNLLVIKAICDRYPIERAAQKQGSFLLTQRLVAGQPMNAEKARMKALSFLSEQNAAPLFLLCNGTLGSPSIQNHAVQAKNLSEEAADAMRSFLLNRHNVWLDEDSSTFTISPFFQWNSQFFGTGEQIFDTVNDLLPEDRQADLGHFRIQRRVSPRFDWRLNDLAAPPTEDE